MKQLLQEEEKKKEIKKRYASSALNMGTVYFKMHIKTDSTFLAFKYNLQEETVRTQIKII